MWIMGLIWLVHRPGLFLTFLFALHGLCILITAQASNFLHTQDGLLDGQPNYKLLNIFFCTLKERNLPFWWSVSLAIFQFEWLTHKKFREPGSCQHDSLHCMVDSPCEPCNDLEGKFVNFKKSVWDTQQSQSPSCQVLLSLLVKQKNLACLSSANPIVSTNFCGVVRAGLYCMSLSKVGHTAFQPPLASGATDMMICATRWCFSWYVKTEQQMAQSSALRKNPQFPAPKAN
jgi:hypothetical protein